MGRFVDAIRCNILEKYMASYMRERSVDALLVLRNESKWAMTGNFLYFPLTIFALIFSFLLLFFSVIFMWYFHFSRRCGSEGGWRLYSLAERDGRP